MSIENRPEYQAAMIQNGTYHNLSPEREAARQEICERLQAWIDRRVVSPMVRIDTNFHEAEYTEDQIS